MDMFQDVSTFSCFGYLRVDAAPDIVKAVRAVIWSASIVLVVGLVNAILFFAVTLEDGIVEGSILLLGLLGIGLCAFLGVSQRNRGALVAYGVCMVLSILTAILLIVLVWEAVAIWKHECDHFHGTTSHKEEYKRDCRDSKSTIIGMAGGTTALQLICVCVLAYGAWGAFQLSSKEEFFVQVEDMDAGIYGPGGVVEGTGVYSQPEYVPPTEHAPGKEDGGVRDSLL